MNALQDQFVSEARDLIQQAFDDLMAAESEGFSNERIERVFRAFHTLKGSAGVVDLRSMALALHAGEDVLAAIRTGHIDAASSVIDALLACLDQVASWVDDFGAHHVLPPDAGTEAQTMVERLRFILGKASIASSVHMPGQKYADKELPIWVGRLLESQAARLRVAPRAPLYCAFSYRPRAACFFDGDDPLALVRRIPNLIALKVDLPDVPQSLTSVDPYACALHLEGVAAAPHADLAEVFRLVLDQVNIAEISVDSLPTLSPARVLDDVTALACLVIREQAELLRVHGDANGASGRTGSALRATIGALHYAGREDLIDAVEKTTADARLDEAAALEVIKEAARSLVVSGEGDNDGSAAGDELPSRPVSRTQSRSLRVDETRVDALVDLAGELLVATHAMAHLAMRAETEGDRSILAHTIRERKEALERTAVAIHESALELRMVPVAQVFRSFPRAVRDLAQQLGKNVRFVTLGEMTEADKAITDVLFEPILHLIRNALDHGIETTDERRAKGKALPAQLTLRTTRAGDRLIVEVVDDGNGIDPQVLRRKAREIALMPDDELAALSDDQALDLIFAVGFSTAASVSSVSGRGVGMDVVRSTIERVGGRVAVKSRLGVGTTVTLDVPMKIALLRIMIVETGGQRVGIPLDTVMETLRLTHDRISRFKANDGFVLRDRVVPICSLAELLGLRAGETSQAERLVVVADVRGKRTAFEVDAIGERLEVVLKPLQGLLSKTRGYAGTTLLGDGTVLLVLDLKEIVP